jgi:hypothetical protein
MAASMCFGDDGALKHAPGLRILGWSFREIIGDSIDWNHGWSHLTQKKLSKLTLSQETIRNIVR